MLYITPAQLVLWQLVYSVRGRSDSIGFEQMTVPAVPVESILVSHEELNNSRTGNVATVVHDEDVVTPQQRSRPTLSAILRDAKKVACSLDSVNMDVVARMDHHRSP